MDSENNPSSSNSQSKTHTKTKHPVPEFCTHPQSKLISATSLSAENKLVLDASPSPEQTDNPILKLDQEIPSTSAKSKWKFQSDDTLASNAGKFDGTDSIKDSNLLSNSSLSLETGENEINILEYPAHKGPNSNTSIELLENENYPSPVNLPSNLHRMPQDEILSAIGGIQNMYLAHEIAVNEDFTVESLVQKEDTFHSRVHTQMKQAFWDLFDEQIQETPPNYIAACSVLKEIKNELLGLLLPHNRTIRHMITEEIDIPHIESQFANDAFDFEEIQRYTNFILDTMSQICCPVRDPEIQRLRLVQNSSLTIFFREVLKVLENMKLDMANFLVRESRPAIIQKVVQYERIRFADMLEMKYRMNDDGLKATRTWLNRHVADNRDTNAVIAKAFVELLNWSDAYQWPETVTLDTTRFQKIGIQLHRIGLIGACVLSAGSVYQGMFGNNLIAEFRERAKKYLKLHLTPESIKTEAILNDLMKCVSDEVCSLANDCVREQLNRGIYNLEREQIGKCVEEVFNSDHKIRVLIMRRIMDYAEEVANASSNHPVVIPPGLSIINYEVSATISQFCCIINHNRHVYGDIYLKMLSGDVRINPPKYQKDLGGGWDTEFCSLLKSLRENDANALRTS